MVCRSGRLPMLTPMPTVSALTARLGDLVAGAAAWDQVGLQLGDPAATVHKVGVCHEVNDAVIDSVRDESIDYLVSYHPLLFSPTTSLVGGTSPTGRAHRLIADGVALFVVHTGWDVSTGGTSDSLAATLGLAGVTPFGSDDGVSRFRLVTRVPGRQAAQVVGALTAAGAEAASPSETPSDGLVEMTAPIRRREAVVRALLASHSDPHPQFDLVTLHPDTVLIGRVGNIEPTTVGALVESCKDTLEFDGVRVSGAAARTVSRVAVVPGSGSGFIRAAGVAGAEVLVTGDVGHHRAVEAADAGLAVIDVGHAPSERPGMAALYDALCDRLETPVMALTDISTNPWETA